MSAVTPIRVALVSDTRLCCEGLRRILSGDPAVAVVGEAEPAGVRELVQAASPDVVLADARVEPVLAWCRELRQDRARPRVILFAAEADDDRAVQALEAGARGILSKTATSGDLIKAIHVVHEGQIWARQRVLARIVDEVVALWGVSQAAEAVLAQRLSRREQEILRLTASGLSNHEIADRLEISEATVKAHLTHIFRKLGVRDRSQLLARYPRALRVVGLSEPVEGPSP